ncbi:hypothetical Protein YC6258_00071 [Gynuella sunshinyii YC6258]|uniref:Uncharacterized protein n=1 Tax=Gynuella sunshinyii YC6258 TaxID=1445510 RepID=A0A0C5VCA1_9GAMM|nr:hypothetical Protein YC6258_00071 [Gynuella sunshinyii YC6258]
MFASFFRHRSHNVILLASRVTLSGISQVLKSRCLKRSDDNNTAFQAITSKL